MTSSNPYDELLVSYLAGDLDADQKIMVENWIAASEENRKYFVEVQRVWKLAALRHTLDKVVDQMNVEEKWNRFQQDIAEKETKVVPMAQEALDSTYGEEGPVRKSKVYRLLVGAAIAASVLLVVGLGWKLFVQNKQETPVALDSGKAADRVVAVMRHEVNNTGKDKSIQLADGSTIVLAHNSEIMYPVPFPDKRDITLIGKAYFKVAKDKAKPFTVISDAIATTALGTEFMVTAFPKEAQISVRLYEGKVVVKPVDKANKKMKKDVYLLQGQELVYGSTVVVRAFRQDNAPSSKEVIGKGKSRDNPSIPVNTDGSWFMFNNQSLGQVLDQLSALYNVKIIYKKKDVQDIYWTGQYNKSDSLEIILNRIGTLNNLTITRKDSAFLISK